MSEASTWREKLTQLCDGPELASSICPPGYEDELWCPAEQDIKLAWIVYTELRTRIATQVLPLRSGVESTALASLLKLFDLAREAVKAHPQAFHATSLLIHSLNSYLRPLTARWHPKSVAGELSSVDQRFIFRAELKKVQQTLRGLAAVLGQMTGDKQAIALLNAPPSEPLNEDTRRGRLPYGIWLPGLHDRQVQALNVEEQRIIHQRRNPASADPAKPIHNAVGLAISGGGIRSATFALGVVQVLARRRILKDIDVMSTVSGGGYLGSFITSMMSDTRANVGLGPDEQPFGSPDNVESESIRYLRNHSKYLTEGGGETLARMIFSAAYGVVMSFLLAFPFALIPALFAVWCFGLGTTSLGPVGPLVLLSINWTVWILAGASVFLLSILRNPYRGLRELCEKGSVLFLFLGLTIVLAGWTPDLYRAAHGHALYLLAAAFLFPLLLGSVGLWCGSTTVLGRLAWTLFVGFGPLFFLSVWLICVDLVILLDRISMWLTAGVTFAILIYAWLCVNINFASLHLYYRSRLARTYLRRFGQPDSVDPQFLSEANQQNKAPLHLINATVNLPNSKNPELRGRNADFFTFAQHFCGGPSVGWWQTTELEKVDPHLDLGTAMAISGAAAAPRMGTLTSAKYTALLALLNVRLGYWLRKPSTTKIWDKVPGGLYFLRELTGKIDERLKFLNLSDGGHIENLGLYELLRRRCRYIIAIDGEADPDHAFGGLLSAIQMANIDLGVKIDPDLKDLRAGEQYFKRSHFVMTRIDYGYATNGEPIQGLLLVIKLALTGDESELLMRYRRENPSFPHQSTGQQLFSESQFEAYRALGEHAAETAFHELLAGEAPTCTADWLSQLERRLLPKN